MTVFKPGDVEEPDEPHEEGKIAWTKLRSAIYGVLSKAEKEAREARDAIKIIFQNKWPYPNHGLRAMTMLSGALWVLDPLGIVKSDREPARSRDFKELNDELYDELAKKIHDLYCDKDGPSESVFADEIMPMLNGHRIAADAIADLLHGIYPY